jgi:hypothetical protein
MLHRCTVLQVAAVTSPITAAVRGSDLGFDNNHQFAEHFILYLLCLAPVTLTGAVACNRPSHRNGCWLVLSMQLHISEPYARNARMHVP